MLYGINACDKKYMKTCDLNITFYLDEFSTLE